VAYVVWGALAYVTASASALVVEAVEGWRFAVEVLDAALVS
jgi:hypothetical protein